MASLEDLQSQINETVSIMNNNLQMTLCCDDSYKSEFAVKTVKMTDEEYNALFRKTLWQKIKGFFCRKN